jgi:hypothetical protein
VYKTRCENWSPERIVDEIDDRRLYGRPFINHEQRTLVVVTQDKEPTRLEKRKTKVILSVAPYHAS